MKGTMLSNAICFLLAILIITLTSLPSYMKGTILGVVIIHCVSNTIKEYKAIKQGE